VPIPKVVNHVLCRRHAGNAWSKSPADACQAGDVKLNSQRQVFE
jgi:hypothetical protein